MIDNTQHYAPTSRAFDANIYVRGRASRYDGSGIYTTGEEFAVADDVDASASVSNLYMSSVTGDSRFVF